ncbi:hypothetical protein MPUL_42410 [Mycolicibacterium pulveris]|uniref:Cytochrome P450 n=2 Tax=Mycolicibacterium pulveris TaxID=36813 RepID=A0A7I7UQI6_MYCPV|nr:hypothetical protein MPUL_42410 [Mycolicibacterium pulveris]
MTTQDATNSLYLQTPGETFDYLDDLRRNCPVSWDPILRGYLVTKFDDVYNVMFDNARFRLQARPEEQYQEHQPKGRVRTFNHLLSLKNIQPRLQSVVQAEIDLLIDAKAPTGHMEVYDDFAEKLPAHIIGLFFGLDRADFPLLLSYRRARHALFNSPPDAEDIARTAREEQRKMESRMAEVIADHRANPVDDLLTQLIEMTEDGAPLTDEQIVTIVARDLLMAGSETVTNSICNAVYRMLTIPGLYDKLVADPSLVPAFVEEALRFDPPVQIFWRATEEDVEISGCPIAKDTQLYTSIASANRDPEVFSEPKVFDLTRPKGKHITFSVGLHKCPGHFLARYELEMSIASLLSRLPNLRIDPDAEQPQYVGVALRNWGPIHLLFDAPKGD